MLILPISLILLIRGVVVKGVIYKECGRQSFSICRCTRGLSCSRGSYGLAHTFS